MRLSSLDIDGSRILVTGGAGLLGSGLVGELISLGFDVTVIDNLRTGSLDNLPKTTRTKSLSFVRANLSEPATYSSKIKDCEVVFHLATMRKWPRDPKGDYAASMGLLTALKETNVRFLLLHSSALVYGNASIVPTPESYSPLKPKMPYEINKLKCEELVTRFAVEQRIPTVILRFANIVGERSFHGVVRDYVERLQADPSKLRVLGGGLQMRSYVHVEDCVSAIEATTKNAHQSVQVYNVASEDAINMNAVVEAVVEEMGPLSPKIIYTGPSNEGGGWLGDPGILLPDTRKIRALGWRATQQSKHAIQMAVRGMRLGTKQSRLLEKAHWDKEFAKLHAGRSSSLLGYKAKRAVT